MNCRKRVSTECGREKVNPTYTHVQSDDQEHGLAEKDDERAAKDVLRPLRPSHRVPLEWCPVAIVASLLTQSLRAFHQNSGTARNQSAEDTNPQYVYSRVSLRQSENDQDEACPGEHRQQPEDPTPRYAGYGHEAAHCRADGRARERCEGKESHRLASRVRVPDVRHDSTAGESQRSANFETRQRYAPAIC